jgi:hypothetical protein
MRRINVMMRSLFRTNFSSFIALCVVVLCFTTSAADAQTGTSSFAAKFHLPGNALVTLDYADVQNFRLTPQNSAFSTLVVDGKIYLQPQNENAASTTKQLYFAGRMLSSMPTSDSVINRATLDLQPSAIPKAGQQAWGVNREVFDVRMPSSQFAPASFSGAPSKPTMTVLTVSEHKALAAAQFEIATRFAASMDMQLCGNAVTQLVSTWRADLAARGLAILASDNGVRLHGTIGALREPVAIPAGYSVVDYQLTTSR